MSLEIHLIDMRHVNDNYNFVLRDRASGRVAVVDPSEKEGVVTFLEARGWRPDVILNTHHHWDHTDGNLALKEHYGCAVVGNAADAARIPGITEYVTPGGSWQLGESRMEILALDGHTIGQVGLYFPQARALFCGDCLFSMGCGRLFEGTAEQLYEGLARIRALPDETQIYCAHEYTVPNGRFARKCEPENEAIHEHIEAAKARLKAGEASIPTTVGQEKRTNPFLRWDAPALRAQLGLEQAANAQVVAELRRLKDGF
jgi:hydroxyacylglutathione hydrolase